MNFLSLIKLFALSYPVFVLSDLLWLGIIMKGTYEKNLGHLMRMSQGAREVNWPAALFVWALIVAGALLFALPQVKDSSLVSGFFWGAVYGLVLYGVYDFTNYALIAHWPLSIVLVDLAWGMFVNGMLVMFLTWLSSRVS